MSRTCRPAAALPVGLLALALLAGLPSAVATRGPVLQAVVSYTPGAAVPQVAGVRVRTVLPAVSAAVVRGNAAALARLAVAPGVRGLAPDDTVSLAGAPAGRSGADLLASYGLDRGAGTPGAGAGVRVAVVDTGVTDSPALDRSSGRLVDAVDTRAVADGGEVRTSGTFDDGYGHGTFMASLVAGGPVDGSGGRGVGVAPGATVLVVRVAEDSGRTSLSQVVAGLDWVAAHADRVDVASLSLSHTRPGRAFGEDPLVAAAQAVRDAGVTVVVAAGNDPGTVGDPGFAPRLLTVGAADLSNGRVAAYSGSAVVAGVRKPDLVASGSGLLGVLPPDSRLARSNPDSRRGPVLFRGSGTSQATAVAAGTAALLLARHPGATPAQVKASLRAAAQDLPGQRDGAGLLDGTVTLVGRPDGTAAGTGRDLTGESGLDSRAWAASSWGASSWGASSWGASSWGASSWGASSWGSRGEDG